MLTVVLAAALFLLPAQAAAPALPAEIPLFPLPETTLFPGVSRPLLIYEPRYRAMIADDIRLSRVMADAVKRHPELQLTSQELSITTFRYVPEDLPAGLSTASVEQELDTLNRALLDRLQREGEAYVSNAIVDGRYVLRACIVNFRTEQADVEALPEIVVRRGRALWVEQRQQGTT